MAILTFTSNTSVLNFASASSWSPASAPTATDYLIFNSSSATCSLNVTNMTCSGIDFTNYNKQFRFNANYLWINGTLSFGNQMSFSFSTAVAPPGAYNLLVSASASITSNGATVGVPTCFYSFTNNNNFYTITDYLNISENFSTGSPNVVATTQTINGGTLSLYKSFAINVGGNLVTNLTTGSSSIVMLGTGTITTQTNTSGGLSNNFIINSPSTISFSGTLYYRTGTLKLLSGRITSGTLTATGNYTLDLSASSSSNVQSITLGAAATGYTITLLSDAHVLGVSITSISITFNGSDVYAYGSTPFASGGTGNITGTSVLRITGTSSASVSSISNSGNINSSISIQTPGTLNWNQVLWYAKSGGSTITYTSGTMLFNGQNFQVGNGTNQHTFYTSGTTFNNIYIFNSAAGANLNLQEQLNATTFTIPALGAVSFTGSYGFSVSTLSAVNPTTTRTGISLKANINYNVNRNLSILPVTVLGISVIYGIKSTTPGQQAKLILAPGASQSLYAVATDDIDSSAGQTIWVYNYDTATASTNTTNWRRIQYTSIQSFASNVS